MSSPKSQIRLKIDHETLHRRTYTELGIDLGSEASTLFHLGTDV